MAKKQKKSKVLGIYFTDEDLNNQRIRNLLIQLVEIRLHSQFVGKKYIIVGDAEHAVLKRSGSSVVDYKLYKKKGVNKLKIDNAVEVGKYKGRRILVKKEK